jgi:hypothetical protein
MKNNQEPKEPKVYVIEVGLHVLANSADEAWSLVNVSLDEMKSEKLWVNYIDKPDVLDSGVWWGGRSERKPG